MDVDRSVGAYGGGTFEFRIDEAELNQALVSHLPLGLGGGHQSHHFNKHGNRHFRLVLTAEQSSQAKVGFRQQGQGLTSFVVHFAWNAGIKAAEGTTEIPVKRQQLFGGLAGIVVSLASGGEVSCSSSGVTFVNQGLDG